MRTPEIAGGIETPPPPPLRGGVCTDEGRSYSDVITTFSRLDGLPIFRSNGALRAEPPPIKLLLYYVVSNLFKSGQKRHPSERALYKNTTVTVQTGCNFHKLKIKNTLNTKMFATEMQ